MTVARRIRGGLRLVGSQQSSDGRRRARRLPALIVRAGQLELSARSGIPLVAARRRDHTLFNLDVHTSVIADLRCGFSEADTGVVSWSLSRHNHLFRRVFTSPDPVRVVNKNTWTALDDRMMDRFLDVYGRLLRRFDGFVVTYPPSFAPMFASLDRPILAVSATRYETPFTDRPAEWRRLNATLRALHRNGTLHLWANNRGDADYLHWYTGLTPLLVPSLCEYTGVRWNPAGDLRAFQARRPDMARRLANASDGRWLPRAQLLGNSPSWARLAQLSAIAMLPYNISTMQLFEFATMGLPVVVPSRRLLKELAMEGTEALSELSFAQIHRMEITGLISDVPNNYGSPAFLDWWLARADFYDPQLMPNIDTIDELADLRRLPPMRLTPAWARRTERRNAEVRSVRSAAIQSFTSLL